MSGSAGAGTPLRVLVVCTGNVCRSPAVELLLRSRLGGTAGIDVTSAGVDALVGEPVAGPMARLLTAAGVDPGRFTARQLEVSDIRAADLVLTMTTAQRRSVVTLLPSAVRRTFTLVEFAAIAELAAPPDGGGGPAERAAAIVAAAPRARALRGPAGDDDVEDPYRRSDEVFQRVFDVVDGAVARVVAVLGAAGTARTALTGSDRTAVLTGATRSGGDTR